MPAKKLLAIACLCAGTGVLFLGSLSALAKAERGSGIAAATLAAEAGVGPAAISPVQAAGSNTLPSAAAPHNNPYGASDAFSPGQAQALLSLAGALALAGLLILQERWLGALVARFLPAYRGPLVRTSEAPRAHA